VPYALATVLFAGYAGLSVGKHLRVQTSGYDLGIFEQAVRAYAELRAPVAELKGPGVNLLGDHFHPVLALLAPAYRLFPSPVTLLVAQALLLAASAIPVTRLAIGTAGTVAGGCLGVAYGLSWGLQEAVGFDFHEVCFAVPLLAMSLERLATRRWAAAVAWAAPLVLVKEDLPATVVAIGGYLLLRRQWRLGAATVLGGVAAGLLIVLVAIPAANPRHQYGYAHLVAPIPENPVARLLTPDIKIATVVLLLLPTGFLALRSGLLLLAVPTLLWRFWSTNPFYWGTGFHYSAVLMPIVFVAFADALGRLAPSTRDRRRRLARLAAPVAAVGALAATVSFMPLGALADPGRTRPPAMDRAAVVATLRVIPDGATVAASNRLAPQLTARCRVFLFPNFPDPALSPEWIATTDDPDGSLVPASRTAERQAEALQRGYQVVAQQAGVVVLHRSG
jgi:uncharacterized membrane protein